jgi:Nucleotidyl transferase AbiEii toxin, Type IV TA system
MISRNSFSLPWLQQVAIRNNRVDLILVEKVVRALSLLEGLVESNLDFIFKGGTALMLHMNSSRRLSIDIDIIVPNRSDIQPLLEKIAIDKGFLRVEEQARAANYAIQKTHYKFFYNPSYKTAQDEEYVLLDIVFEDIKYSNLVTLPIDSDFVEQEGLPVQVRVPSLDDLLGDKLTAFAPYTTGIPYSKNGVSRAMEIIKQLYDIGNLFDVSANMGVITSTFQNFAVAELGYRIMGNDWKLVLEDIYNTSLCLCTWGQFGKGEYESIQLGIRQIKGYIFSKGYFIEDAMIHASKAAYLSVLIEKGITVIERFRDPLEIRDWIIEQPFNTKLNKLKKSNPEAFFYWYKIYLLSLNIGG